MNKIDKRIEYVKNSHLQPTTYFTISGGNSQGFTDQLLIFSGFYKLGLSLGYRYAHTKFRNSRSSNKVYSFLGFNEHFAFQLDDFLGLEIPFALKVYIFLGGYNYRLDPIDRKYEFSSPTRLIKKIIRFGLEKTLFHKFKLVNIRLSDEILKNNKISDLHELQNFVKNLVSNNSNSTNKQIIVQFQLISGGYQFLHSINSKIRNFSDGLDLRSIYFKTRRKHPRKSRFMEEKLKLLVHIRQGDTAVIKTPWQTFIQTFIPEKGKRDIVTEFENINDVANNLIEINDFYNFVKNIISYFDENIFSIVVCSDGYKRGFRKIYHNADQINLTSDKIQELRKTETLYEKKFEIFKNIKNSTLLVGENDENLYNLIHSSLIADIIVFGVQPCKPMPMISKLIANYYDLDNPPIIILLFKTEEPPHHEQTLSLLDSRKAKIIPVRLDNINFEDVVTRISQEIKISCSATIKKGKLPS
ncbi:MAG: hypothetical protein AB4206_15875 [Xenococcaceae cyanobacterium]